LQFAKSAKAGLPNAHHVDDTLGWACYKKGMGSFAVAALKQAAAAQPENAEYLYHFGAAYALKRDKVSARQNLEKALKIQANFAGADDARRILASLN
jgi:Flp pilus assembly protein TadD